MLRMKILQSILAIITLLLLASISQAKSSKHSLRGLRINLRHIDSKGNFTKHELLQRMTRRSHQRMARLVRKSNNVLNSEQETSTQADVHVGSGEYVMDIAIGTPSVSYPAIIDTGSDLIWTQCNPCERCFEQPTKIFDPSTSSTFKVLPCSAKICKALPYHKCNNTNCHYQYAYGDQSFTTGSLSSETFTLGSKRAPGIAFGCGYRNSDGFAESSGLVGLGRSKLSLISQMKFKEFSYCFSTLDLKKQSPMFFGKLSHVNDSAATGPVQSTPLLTKPKSSFYYLSLIGMTVGTTKLDIPSSTFAIKNDGSGGMIIDSGTTITFLEQTGYSALKKAFISQVNLPVADGSDIGFDLCFSVPSNTSYVFPKLILHFDGADLNLPESNYLMGVDNTSTHCLTIMGSTDMSILGSMQQANFKIIYDIKNEKLTFIPTLCDKL